MFYSRRHGPSTTLLILWWLFLTACCHLLRSVLRSLSIPHTHRSYLRDGTTSVGHARATQLPQVLRPHAPAGQEDYWPGDAILAGLRRLLAEVGPRTHSPRIRCITIPRSARDQGKGKAVHGEHSVERFASFICSRPASASATGTKRNKRRKSA